MLISVPGFGVVVKLPSLSLVKTSIERSFSKLRVKLASSDKPKLNLSFASKALRILFVVSSYTPSLQ